MAIMEPLPPQERKLLIVDDEPNLRKLIMFDFSGRGYRVVPAADGEEAVRKARAERFDLVLCDIRMPGTDGLETLRRLKRLQPDLRVVMVTGYPSSETKAEAFQSGASAYLVKPYDLEHLASVLARVMAAGPDSGPPRQEALARVASWARLLLIPQQLRA
jgi:CheY-like chemotaxis protein